MIARTWRGWVETSRADEYETYLDKTGLSEYAATSGNLGAHLLRRDLDDGSNEFVKLSLWDSWNAVRLFAGDDPSQAVFYPEDDDFLVDRETTVTHFDVPWSTDDGS